jgi:putative oxidoreductase
MLAWLNFVFLPMAARLCLVVLFPFSGVDKIIHWDVAMAQAKSTPVPFVGPLLAAAIVVELVTPFCIMFGWHDHLAAFVLAGFCVMTAVLYHQFWRFTDFWARGESVARNHFWDFLKNFGLVGGLLLLIIAGTLLPAQTVLQHPLASAPYAAQQE